MRQSLPELAAKGRTFVPLVDLAAPFSEHLCEHLAACDKQATSKSSRFLDECRRFNRGEIAREHLIDATVRLGFNNVIDAFQVVGSGPLSVEFYKDERDSAGKGIRLTDELFRLGEMY
jgi:hypothetical protein